MDKKDYYKILGIEKNASDEEIKRAYKTLIKENHPDVGGDQEKAKDINTAYECLSDSEKRKQYDFGSIDPNTFNPFESFFNGNDPLGNFFKFSFGDNGRNFTTVNQINKTYNLSFKDFLEGKDIEFDVNEVSSRIKFKLPDNFVSGNTYQIKMEKTKKNILIVHLRIDLILPDFTTEQKEKIKDLLYGNTKKD